MGKKVSFQKSGQSETGGTLIHRRTYSVEVLIQETENNIFVVEKTVTV